MCKSVLRFAKGRGFKPKFSMNFFMWRKLTAVLLSLLLCVGTVGCGSSTQSDRNTNTPTTLNNNTGYTASKLADGKYPVQQATYNDADGQYSLMLLNTPAGSPPVYNTANLQMARLTEEEVSKGEKTYLTIENNNPVMHLTEDFKIEYVHNVTETRNNPQTGQTETVIVRQQSGFWAPFAGALAGQALGSLLFRPQYYVPPVYQPGGVLTGYGGYGSNYNDALRSYETRYKAPAPVVRNRQIIRTTGSLKNYPNNRPVTTKRPSTNNSRSSGSGFGASDLGSSGKSSSQKMRQPSRNSFGSGTSNRRPTRSGSFGSRGRRR